MKAKIEAINWIKSKINKGIDWDGYYGYQCMDLAIAYIYYITDGKVTMWGNAKDTINNDFRGTAKVIKNTPSFEPQIGDLAVWTKGNFKEYGHVSIITEGNPEGNLQTFYSLDQNWYGGGLSRTEFAQIIKHDYTGLSHFIRPNFKIVGEKAQSVSNISSKQKNNEVVSNNLVREWKKNKYGTWYKSEESIFVCGTNPILARVNSPFLSAPEGYWFQPGGYVNYDEVCIQNDHVWIGYTYKGVRYYLPIRTVKGTPPNHELGPLWGRIN